MIRLPVIVGFGGVNPAGRSSFHHGYHRLIFDKLSSEVAQHTCLDLATMMGMLHYRAGHYEDFNCQRISAHQALSILEQILHDYTLVRRINAEHFDVDAVPFQEKVTSAPTTKRSSQIIAHKSQIPDQLPADCRL